MTCIVGVVNENDVYLGADSYCGRGSEKEVLTSGSKIFRLFESSRQVPILLASCGDVRTHQLLQYALKVPAWDEGKSLMHYLVCDFAEAVRTCFDEGGRLYKHESVDRADYSALLAIDGRLFVLTNGFSIEESNRGFYAFASGSEFASASLWHSRGQPPQERLRTALETAVEFADYVAPPFHIEKL
ncbi:hypothetical protein IAD21_00578 [Abditibacteriota bacterium]|nr:hypothetical protein IAD21_00578 [Abditibacteriota bacterium]